MKNLQFRVPDGIHSQLKQLASQEGVSLNQLLVVAASNELVRNETRDFFRQAASAYHADDFASALAAVANGPVEESDELTV